MGLKRCLINSTSIITLALYPSIYYVYFLSVDHNNLYIFIPVSITFHVFLILSFASFLFTMFLNPGSVPENFSLDSIPDSQKQELVDEFREIDFSLGRVTFCKKCDRYRPPRAHHCGTCGKCILRFDHHCPFVANCVGIRNHKAFVLFLIYTGLGMVVVSIAALVKMDEDREILWFIVAPLCCALGIYIIGFALTQVWMLVDNFTTLETSWKYNIFDTKDKCENLFQVMGKNKISWIFPFANDSDEGICFPVAIREKTGGIVIFRDKFLI